MRRLLAGSVVLAAVASLVAAFVASQGTWGSYDRYRLDNALERRRAPAWTRSCLRSLVVSTTQACVMVTGRVVWRQAKDPDGDGDRHLVVVERFHVRLVKLPPELPLDALPGIGATVSAVGYDVRGTRDRQEVRASYVRTGSRSYRYSTK